MLKKTLLASVVAGLGICSVSAADVQIYGRIDTGFTYAHHKLDRNGQSSSTDTFSMDTGNSTSNRWGLIGSEDLGNGLKAGFVLESGFDADTGELKSGLLFSRESTLWLEGDFGRVLAGRMTGLLSDAGSVGFYGGLVSPFGTGWGELAGHAAVMGGYDTSRYDNAIAYVSPQFAGVTLYAMYAMGTNDNENESRSDRYAALGASYINGPLQLAAVVDYLNKQSAGPVTMGKDKVDLNVYGDPDDAWTLNLGSAYDFGVAKVYGAVQYFKNAPDIGDIVASGYDTAETDKAYFHSFTSLEGFAVNIGSDIALAGGLFKLSAGYMDGELNQVFYPEIDRDVKGYNVMAGYEYPLSRRTNVYAGAGYTKYEVKGLNDQKEHFYKENEIFAAMFGLVHKF